MCSWFVTSVDTEDECNVGMAEEQADDFNS
jgi:hypothetical protein